MNELKAAYETKEISAITPALDKINEAWKNASEEMYKAQAEGQGQPQGGESQAQNEGDNVQDVEFEEVK